MRPSTSGLDGWTAPSARLQREVAAGDGWIIDGNHLGTFEVRAAAADAVVVLDLPGWLWVWRTVRSGGRGGPGRSDRLGGFSLRFLWRAWTFRRRVLSRVKRCLAALRATARVLRLRAPPEVDRWRPRSRPWFGAPSAGGGP